ncbi:MAG: multicopper oxidase domain-containing protein [Flavobacteriales bacterium]|nr:multicopper oxidase domain-containing protein [Flavobacteriales bacterium]
MRRIITTLLGLMWMTLIFAQNDVDVFLIARNTGEKVLSNNDTIRVFGFADNLGSQPGVPGPTIIANEGDSVHIDVWNVSQGAPHTIHLHGLDVDQQNDGVPHLSFDIPHMDHGFYHFKAPHAGTYLYHCHVASTIHVQAGMYGLIIIKPTDGSNTTWNNGYYYHHDFSYFLSEIDTLWHTDSVLEHDHDTAFAIHYIEIPKFDPQFFLINGFSDQQLAENQVELISEAGSRNYIRLTNIGYCGVRVIMPSRLFAKIIDSDGRPLPQVEITDTIYVYPGERYGVLTEAFEEFTDSIEFEYFDLNTNQPKNSQFVPVTIAGFNRVEEVNSSIANVVVSPNPLTSETVLTVDLKQNTPILIEIWDIEGKLVDVVENAKNEKGVYQYFIGQKLTVGGIYLVKVTIGDEVITRKIVKK